MKDMKIGQKCWCWWMHRILWFRGTRNHSLFGTMYVFQDAGDCVIEMTADQVDGLEEM